jgi:hypothetical protein
MFGVSFDANYSFFFVELFFVFLFVPPSSCLGYCHARLVGFGLCGGKSFDLVLLCML